MKKPIINIWKNYISPSGTIERKARQEERMDRKLKVKVHKQLKKELSRIPTVEEFEGLYRKKEKIRFWFIMLGLALTISIGIYRMVVQIIEMLN